MARIPYVSILLRRNGREHVVGIREILSGDGVNLIQRDGGNAIATCLAVGVAEPEELIQRSPVGDL